MHLDTILTLLMGCHNLKYLFDDPNSPSLQCIYQVSSLISNLKWEENSSDTNSSDTLGVTSALGEVSLREIQRVLCIDRGLWYFIHTDSVYANASLRTPTRVNIITQNESHIGVCVTDDKHCRRASQNTGAYFCGM